MYIHRCLGLGHGNTQPAFIFGVSMGPTSRESSVRRQEVAETMGSREQLINGNGISEEI